jgi:hypothetical protein
MTGILWEVSIYCILYFHKTDTKKPDLVKRTINLAFDFAKYRLTVAKIAITLRLHGNLSCDHYLYKYQN